jgi:transposase InsO family protein
VTLHKNARTMPASRRLIAERVLNEGWTLTAAAAAAGVSVTTARTWVRRFQAEGDAGLDDRSSRPHRSPRRTPAEREQAVLALRGARLTALQIADTLQMPPSTVSLILKRNGHGKLPRLGVEIPVQRYERSRPGELVHIDIKKLGRINGPGHRATGRFAGHNRARGAGWDYVHVAIDDATRLAYVEVLGDERPKDVIAFLRRVVAHFASLGVSVERVMTDNGNPYRSRAHAIACRELAIKHKRTAAYTPRTNGKAERFIRTLVEGWAYDAVFASSAERTAALPAWLDFYNRWRAHRGIGLKTPIARLMELQNVSGAHS